jgi:uncharacterized membrane protein YkgB
MKIKTFDLKVIKWFRRAHLPLARLAIFIIYFYFGILKLLNDSPATAVAHAMVAKLGLASHFHLLFMVLAGFECLIGILFLFPKLTRVVIPLLLLHMITVCLPLFINSNLTFSKPFVPTLEGQYIIKNIAVIALAIGVAAQTTPLLKSKS